MIPLNFTVFLIDVALPVLAAIVFGGLVGLERESWRKPAGLRTHMMVALGAATFTMAGLRVIGEGIGGGADPSRIIEAVATGIGFLGAGTIIRSAGRVRGVTTAAGIWVVGAVGACCGAGFFDIAAIVTISSMIVLAPMRRLESSTKGSTEEEEEDEEE